MTAVISQCGTYRYRLDRYLPEPWQRPPLVFVMLNPSTADATKDDPTIRRCMGFARRELAAGIVVVNLYALRSTDPAAIKTRLEPVGYENDEWIARAAKESGGELIAAWGANAEPWRVKQVMAMPGINWRCLGVTKNGSPRHPLYVRADQPLREWPAQFNPRTFA